MNQLYDWNYQEDLDYYKDPLTGAHFEYTYLFKRLSEIAKNNQRSIFEDEDEDNVPDEDTIHIKIESYSSFNAKELISSLNKNSVINNIKIDIKSKSDNEKSSLQYCSLISDTMGSLEDANQNSSLYTPKLIGQEIHKKSLHIQLSLANL